MIKVRQAVLAGVCGYEKEFSGKIIHLLPIKKEDAAICGKAPTGRSKGWSDPYVSWPGAEIGCSKCRKALAEGKCELA